MANYIKYTTQNIPHDIMPIKYHLASLGDCKTSGPPESPWQAPVPSSLVFLYGFFLIHFSPRNLLRKIITCSYA